VVQAGAASAIAAANADVIDDNVAHTIVCLPLQAPKQPALHFCTTYWNSSDGCSLFCGLSQPHPNPRVLMQQAQLHCSALPSFAQTPPPAWQDTPCDPLGLHINPRDVGLSLLDEQAGPHVLCCGHMLHDTCLARHR